MKFDTAEEAYDSAMDWICDTGGQITLEIGAGKAEYMLNCAHENSMDAFILLEMNNNFIKEIRFNSKKRKLKNVFVIHGIAHIELGKIDIENYISNVISFFPSPRKDKKNTEKLFDELTCDQIIRLTNKDSFFYAISDIEFAINAFERNLSPRFRKVDWKLPYTEIDSATSIGTEIERKFIDHMKREALFLRMVRAELD